VRRPPLTPRRRHHETAGGPYRDAGSGNDHDRENVCKCCGRPRRAACHCRNGGRLAAAHRRILPTLLRLSVPNVLALVMSVLVGVAETYYVGQLGTVPLAAMALVFPFAMLTQMMSNGAMGGACPRPSAGRWGG
jgi:hypothetical protein